MEGVGSRRAAEVKVRRNPSSLFQLSIGSHLYFVHSQMVFTSFTWNKGLRFSRGTTDTHWPCMRVEPMKKLGGLQVRWIHRAQDCVLSSSRQRWEWTDTDSSPLCHTFAPLLSLSLSLTFTSNILQLSPLHCPSPAIPQRVSLLLRTCLLSWSPHPNPTDWEKRGEKKQPTGQSAAATCRLAGGDPWPFAPAAFSWAAESVRWPHPLNVERPLTGCRGRRRSIWRETEWEVTECDAQLFHYTADPNLLIKCYHLKANVLQECNI